MSAREKAWVDAWFALVVLPPRREDLLMKDDQRGILVVCQRAARGTRKDKRKEAKREEKRREESGRGNAKELGGEDDADDGHEPWQNRSTMVMLSALDFQQWSKTRQNSTVSGKMIWMRRGNDRGVLFTFFVCCFFSFSPSLSLFSFFLLPFLSSLAVPSREGQSPKQKERVFLVVEEGSIEALHSNYNQVRMYRWC